jgi:hypothetical protein
MRAGSAALLFASGVSVLLGTGCAGFGSREPSQWDGLVRQRNARLGALFVKPDVDIAVYQNVVLDPVEVRFSRSWNPNRTASDVSRRLDARDVAAIQTRLAELVHEIFAEELNEAGYPIVAEAGHDTLRVTAAIVDLYVSAPDTLPPGRVTIFTADSGRMTLVLELRDSVTGEILARAVDTRTGRRSGGGVTVTSRTTNTADARRAIRVWAGGLRQALAEMYAPKP